MFEGERTQEVVVLVPIATGGMFSMSKLADIFSTGRWGVSLGFAPGRIQVAHSNSHLFLLYSTWREGVDLVVDGRDRVFVGVRCQRDVCSDDLHAGAHK